MWKRDHSLPVWDLAELLYDLIFGNIIGRCNMSQACQMILKRKKKTKNKEIIGGGGQQHILAPDERVSHVYIRSSLIRPSSSKLSNSETRVINGKGTFLP